MWLLLMRLIPRVKQPCHAIDIYAKTTTFDTETDVARVTGDYTMPDKKPTPFHFFFEISEYEPPVPPDVTNAYGDQGSIGPRTPRRLPNLRLSIRSDTVESVPSLDHATGTSESSYSLRSPRGSVTTDNVQFRVVNPTGEGGQDSEVEDEWQLAPPTDVQD